MIHFGAFKNHFGLYPGAEAVKTFEEKFQNYKTSKSYSISFYPRFALEFNPRNHRI
jgi:uncharacterized protein YdhG (YjbR/CyaY superfamily)